MINKISRKSLVLGIAILFMGVCIISGSIGTKIDRRNNTIDLAYGKTLYVGGSGGDNYTTIQEAIDAATNGDIVFVYDNSSPYPESININKQISVIGENRDTTIINGESGPDYIVHISSDNAEINGFTISGETGEQNGIKVYKLLGVKNSSISNNIIKNNSIGILLQVGSVRITITNNMILNNEYEGIELSEGDHNEITGNTIEDNGGSGIVLETLSEKNEISGNTIEGNLAGIKLLGGSNQNTISGNKITNNERDGILADGILTKANDIIGNNITNNKVGIKISSSGKNTITSNNIKDNSMEGVYLTLSNENIIEKNNFIGNRKNARYLICFRNTWDANYWDDWIGVKLELPLFRMFPKVIRAIVLRSYDWHPQDVPYNI